MRAGQAADVVNDWTRGTTSREMAAGNHEGGLILIAQLVRRQVSGLKNRL